MGNWRAFVLRHLLGRFHIGEDIVRHLSTFQRLGETLEIAPPGEMLPVGARTLFRAVRTRGAAQIRPDWLWPYWLQAQLDPTAPAFTPRGHLPAMQNVTHRNWTMVGNCDSPWEAIVDPTGLVTPWFDGWSLDWWVQVEGTWHLPSRSSQIRQSLLGTAPVVVTTLELPAGDVVQRTFGTSTEEDLVVVEVENTTRQPMAVAFALRPYNPEGLAVVEELRVESDRVLADGREAVLFAAPPLGVALGAFAVGDSVQMAQAGTWRRPGRARIKDRAGLAQGAFLFDLPPRGLVRVAMPASAHTRRRRLPEPHAGPPAVQIVGGLPSGRAVGEQWRQRLAGGVQVELPDERLQQAVDANRAFMLLLHDPGDITAGPFTYHRFWFRDAAYQIAALDRWGFFDEAADVLRTYPARQQADGFFYSQWREWDANGAAIWTIAEHHRLTGDETLLAELTAAVEKGAGWIVRMCADDAGKAPEARGLLPAGVSAEHLGPFDYYYWDDLWAWRGLLDAAEIARWRGRPQMADGAQRAARALQQTLLASFEQTAARMGHPAVPAGPTRGVDAGMIGSLAACYPLRLLRADDPWMVGTAETIRQFLCLGDAFYQGISHTGLGTYLTLQLAFVELESGDQRAWRRLQWLLDAATPTFTWPEAIHPQLPGGCMGDGHHGWMAADLLNFVRMLLVRESDDALVLLSYLPPEWHGRRVALHRAPTAQGMLSYELDWEADRPVLRWESDRSLRLRAPALQPGWMGEGAAGEARLAPLTDAARGGGSAARS